MTEGKCAIWGTEAERVPFLGEPHPYEYNSPRAGGRYKISGTAKAMIENGWSSDNEFKAKLTTWLVDVRMQGEGVPSITANVVENIKDRNLLSNTVRISRFFHYLSHVGYRIGDEFIYENQHRYKEGFDHRYHVRNDFDESTNMAIMAYSECLTDFDLDRLSQYLLSCKLIEADRSSEIDAYILTPLGMEKLDSLSSNINSKQAFVAMWFDPNDKSVFDEGIKPAIEIDPYGKETGFKAFRVDQEHHTDFIMDFMIGNIKRSRFMVADFTSFMIRGHKVLDGKALSAESEDFQIGRGGVYYEAGFAQGLGIPVIATCRDDQKGHIHFDLKQFNTIYWKDVADLRKQLSDRIFGMFVS